MRIWKKTYESSIIGTSEVVADQSTSLIICIEEGKAKGTTNVGNKKEHNKVATGLGTFRCHIVIQKHTSQDTDGDEDAFQC